MRRQKERVEGSLAWWKIAAKVKIAQTGGQEGEASFPRVANGLRWSCTAVISQIVWQVTATDVPSICGELITH